jgi:hypothetical protein
VKARGLLVLRAVFALETVCNRSLHSHYDYALQELVALYIVWETHFQVVIWRFLDYVDMVHLSEVVFTVSSWIERINTREIWM